MAIEVFFRPNPQVTIKVECRDAEDIFKQVGPLQEVLNNCKCGKCGKENIRMVHRKADGKYDVYELLCEDCGSRLALGKNDQDNLFPRRYEQDPDDKKKPKMLDGKKVWLPNNGWVKWDTQQNKYT
jgi:DNA-directed RNA polymerase subunit RPC12/RpoP